MDIHRIYWLAGRLFRKRRMKLFFKKVNPRPGERLLDVGGYPGVWRDSVMPCRVVLLNIHPYGGTIPEGFEYVIGNGCHMEYPDGSFEIAYSNSVIEHLSNYENQKLFAREIRRTGQRLWVQTPARSFFIEPHLLGLFIHFLPRSWQAKLIPYFTITGIVSKWTRQDVENFLNEVRLLDYREMRELFPDCKIIRERFLGFTKSYVALRV